ncbi:biotin/lipoyl-binding protein, partial [uncultured Oscillibacter sp.]|uniref:biotin/lipoyl-binding protein n=1 Tax=uncultured Oscillibacter sp. TaxID=876091 RepID=UPI00260F5682
MTKNRILAALLAAVLALSLTACGGADETPEEEPANPGVAVQVQEIGADTIYTENTVSGQLLAEDQSTIMVAVSAKCTAVYAEAGDEVKAGDMLCTLDLGSTLASHNAASINYRSSAQSYNDQAAVFEKQIALAEKNVRDLKELFEIGAASQLEIDQAELQLQTAVAQRNSTLSQLEAGMQSALSNVEQLDTVLENVDARGNVIAPSSGTLVTMNATEGGFISNTAPLAVIDGAEQMLSL